VLLLDITIPGDPISKGRPRSGKGRTYTPKRTREAEAVIRELVDTSPWAQTEPYAGPVSLRVQFYCATHRRTDGDNLLKLVTDAIQRGRRESGGIIADDAQIEEWYCRVYRKAEGEEPRTEITLTPLD
jgi:crossover junction endodeoxyribonuclease RusA